MTWWATLLMMALVSDGITSQFVSEGITKKTGGYRPIRCEMDQDADIVKKGPDGLVAPKYGKMKLDGKEWGFILDEPEGAAPKWYVDANADGDFTNDAATTWGEAAEGGRFEGETKILLAPNQMAQIRAYRFDPNDERRKPLKNTLLFYTDFGYELTITLDGKEFKSSVAGMMSANTPLWLDRDGNGRPSRGFELVKVDEPFNFTGSTFVLSLKDGELSLAKAKEALPQKPLPPDLQIGKPALSFDATTMEGSKVSFPKSYAGKLVMLDFWATWCGPCIGEVPHMKEAYENWHDKGFEILGISFDFPDTEAKVKEFLTEKELPWSQVYEGKGWETSIGIQHDVSGIPFVLLVDGDTGEILATAAELRGEGLSDFIGKALEKKNSK